MSKANSNPTRVAHEAAIAHHRHQQTLKTTLGTGMVEVQNPNRAQRRAAKKYKCEPMETKPNNRPKLDYPNLKAKAVRPGK